MSDSLNIAIVGAGFWGKNLVRNFHQLGTLSCIYDPSGAVRKKMQDTYPDVPLTDSFEEILENPDTDAVAIANPAEMHYNTVKKSLLAGKHVFVEKPLALTEEEGQELVRLAEGKKRTLFVGHLLQYHPAISKLKEMIRDGELGKIQYVYSNRLNLGKFRREENILWSFAPHDISVILSLVGEQPSSVSATGSAILHPEIADTTTTHLKFPSGVSAHIFVSWLHPFKEQKLVVIGDRKMTVFDDLAPVEKKLILYPHNILWQNGQPVPEKKEGLPIDLSKDWDEPLKLEALAFIDAVAGKPHITDGAEGLRVLKVLQKAQESLVDRTPSRAEDYFVHETSTIDPGCTIGKGSKIWHYSHILTGSKLGAETNIGQNVMIGPNGTIGNNVKIQNNVSVYDGVILEDEVFCGPSCVFTNVATPRSAFPRKNEYHQTLVKRGATIGANATIVCGITIGRNAFIGAGAVVTKDVPDHALVFGNPATVQGWMCECGCRLDESLKCGQCGRILDAALTIASC